MDKKKYHILKFIEKYSIIFIGSVIAAVGLEIFLIPNSIIDGGIVGISIITSFITDLPMGLFTFLFNIPYLFIGYKQIGKT